MALQPSRADSFVLFACAEATGREEGQSPAAAKKLVRKLGKQRVANMFTHLRKIAQHPLLVRRLFSDELVAKMATLAHARCSSTSFLLYPQTYPVRDVHSSLDL
jgi:hypothetical protein